MGFMYKARITGTASLEFTQAQVDDLKEENKLLRECIGDLETEMLRNKYAITKIEGR